MWGGGAQCVHASLPRGARAQPAPTLSGAIASRRPPRYIQNYLFDLNKTNQYFISQYYTVSLNTGKKETVKGRSILCVHTKQKIIVSPSGHLNHNHSNQNQHTINKEFHISKSFFFNILKC